MPLLWGGVGVQCSLSERRAEHGGACAEEELGGACETGADEIGGPVEPLVLPVAREQSRSECARGVEGASGDGGSDEGEEAESESDGDGGKTGLGVSGGGVDGELLALSGLVAFLGRGGLDGIESSGEDDVNEDVGEDELHQEHLAEGDVLRACERDEGGGGLSAHVDGEDDPEQEASESGTSQLGGDVGQTLERRGLTGDDSGEGNGGVEVCS